MRTFYLDGAAILARGVIRLTSRNPVETSVVLVVVMAVTLFSCS